METMKQQTLLVEATDYRRLLEQVPEERLAAAFIGIWASRDGFGLELLDDSRADERLQTLPLWLKPYVKLDGEALVNDMEAAGHYVISDITRGIAVFDGPAARNEK